MFYSSMLLCASVSLWYLAGINHRDTEAQRENLPEIGKISFDSSRSLTKLGGLRHSFRLITKLSSTTEEPTDEHC